MKNKIAVLFFISISIINSISAQSIQKVQVTGHILDTNNKPIQDAVIMVDNVKIDAFINSKGFYKIKIPANTKNIMVFSVKSGLKEHEFKGETVLNFTLGTGVLTNSSDKNDKSVDIGYGTAKKSELTSSVGSVSNNENSTYRNIFEMIAGKVPGVTVTGSKIVIRGISSINAGTDPLFVVDGNTTNNIHDINPSQVDNISILKGSNAAMYGARGANGVILINLKKAKNN